MESILLKLGAGFSFVARQKRIQIDDEDFHLDLLFYNRKLRRLVAVELKTGEFKAAYMGQGRARTPGRARRHAGHGESGDRAHHGARHGRR